MVFTYVPLPALYAIFPSSGPLQGGTNTIIVGEYFDTPMSKTDVVCRFGSKLVRAVYLKRRVVSCVTPFLNFTKAVRVDLSADGGNSFSQSGLIYEFQDLPVISSIDPPAGIESGGNTVKIMGSGFQPSKFLACKFGGQITDAVFLSSEKIGCVVPKGKAGIVSLTMTLNGVDWTTQEIIYNFIPTGVIHTITPESAPIQSDLSLTVTGTNFALISGLMEVKLHCTFGKWRSLVTIISDDILSCEIPTIDVVGNVTFDIIESSGNSVLKSKKEFEIYSLATISSIEPSFGSINGGTNIHVYGGGFKEAFDCIFQVGDYYFEMAATVYSRNSLTCRSPNFSRLGFSSYRIHATLGLVKSTETSSVHSSYQKIPYLFKALPAIRAVHPRVGEFHGGTPVKVYAVADSGNWTNSSYLSCRFGETVVSATWINPEAVECTSPGNAIGGNNFASVSVTDNGIDYSFAQFEESGLFHFADPPIVFSISPNFGLNSGHKYIKVYGQGFTDFGSSYCVLKELKNVRYLIGQVLSDHEMECRLPQSHYGVSEAYIHVSNNGVEHSSSSATFKYVSEPQIISLTPNSGYVGRFFFVTVTGSNLGLLGPQSKCLIEGGYSMDYPVTHSNKTALICEISCPREATRYMFSITVDGSSKSTTGIPFYCDPAPILLRVAPNTFVEGEEAELDVYGKNFRRDNALSCSFSHEKGYSVVSTVFVSAALVRCPVPRFDGPGISHLKLVSNGLYFGEGGSMNIEIIQQVTTNDVSPRIVTAGSRITISGTNFAIPSHLVCKVGGVLASRVDVVSDDLVVCELSTETHTQEDAAVQISWNAVTFTDASANMAVRVLPTPMIQSVEPSAGLRTGGTIVNVKGHSFESEPIFCVFGEIVVEAMLVSESLVRCMSPPADFPGNVMLQVSIDGIATASTKSEPFYFFEPIFINSITPSLGSLKGGTTVLMIGQSFDVDQTYDCKFDNSFVNATVVSSSALSCVSPPSLYPQIAQIAVVLSMSKITVSLNRQSFEQSIAFNFIEDPIIYDIQPTSCPLSGCSVVITGNFVGALADDSPSGFCKFGDVVAIGMLDGNGNSLQCEAPSMPSAEIVHISISLNGVDFTTESLNLEYIDNLVISEIFPTNGVKTGGTLVSIVGQNIIFSTLLEW